MQKYDINEFPETKDYSIKKEVTSNLWKIRSKKNNKDFQNRFLSEGEAETYLYKFIKLKFYTEDTTPPEKPDPRLEPVKELSTFTGIVKLGDKLVNPRDRDSQEIIAALHKKEKKEIERTKIRNNRKINGN